MGGHAGDAVSGTAVAVHGHDFAPTANGHHKQPPTQNLRPPRPPRPSELLDIAGVVGGVSVQGWAVIERVFRLPPQQSKVVRGIFDGLTHQVIANEIGRSLHTVDSHWIDFQRNNNLSGHTAAIHKIYEIIIEHRLKQATEPLEQQIAELKDRVQDLESKTSRG